MGVRLSTESGLHISRVMISMPLKDALNMQARIARFPPSTHPKLGVQSRHQGFHRYALQRIFRPFLKTAVLTRILRRCNGHSNKNRVVFQVQMHIFLNIHDCIFIFWVQYTKNARMHSAYGRIGINKTAVYFLSGIISSQ